MNRLLCNSLLASILQHVNTIDPDQDTLALISKLYVEINRKSVCISTAPESVDPLYISALGALTHHFSKTPLNEN